MSELLHPIRLVKEDDHWIVPIQGWNVTQIQIDYAFTLSFWQSDDAYVHFRIGGRFTFCNAREKHELSAEEQPTTALAPALVLFNKELASAVAYENGALELTFRGDMAIFVPADPDYEAWEASGSEHIKLVSMPGGRLAVWLPD